MRYCIFFLFALLAACGQSPAPTSPAPAAPPSGLHFEFSAAALSQSDDDDNWCRTQFPEAQPMYADPANSLRRWFALGEGTYHVVVDLGTTTASFFLRKKGDTVLEVLTSQQLPECASNKANFTMEAGGTRFRYNNQRLIDFDISAEETGDMLRIWIEMPVGAQYGLSVRKG